MKTLVEKRGEASNRLRQTVARERVASHMVGMLDGLDAETRIETCRAAIRALAHVAKLEGGEGRASGLLCGALVEVNPGYQCKPLYLAAEALFSVIEEKV